MGKYNTPFSETEAFLAAAQEDDQYLDELLGSMTRGELTRLRQAADALKWSASDEITRRNDAERRGAS